jgi:O-antigen ligase
VSKKLQAIDWLMLAAVAACTLEGALRKWAIPRNAEWRYLAYFSKDILLGLCLTQRTWAHKNQLLARAKKWIFPGVSLAVLGCAIATTGANMVGAVLTLRSTVVLPLITLALVPKLPRDTVVKSCLMFAALVAINAPLGVVQFFSPTGSWINQYAADSDVIATSGFNERVRATGTFSYLTGYGVFGDAAIAAGLILLSTSKTPRRSNLAMLTVAGGLICAATTVSRSVLAIGAVLVAMWMVFSKQRTRAMTYAVVIIAIGLLTIAFLGLWSQTAEIFTTTSRRHEMVHDPATRRLLTLIEAMPQAISDAPFGNGLGTEQVGGNYYASGRMRFSTTESEWPRIVMEIGVLGYVGVMITYLGSIWVLWSARKSIADTKLKAVFLATILICAAWAFTGVIFNHVTSFYYWAFVAAALALGNEA